jgi:hypothetical protein
MFTDVSEALAASIIEVMMETASKHLPDYTAQRPIKQ